jgi:hypothetical protein
MHIIYQSFFQKINIRRINNLEKKDREERLRKRIEKKDREKGSRKRIEKKDREERSRRKIEKEAI